MAIQATGRATFMAVEDYDIVFVLNGIRCDVLNFDSVRTAESATLEADFYNGGTSCVVDKAVLCCYDGEGSVLGTPIEVHDTSSAVADGGNLYLSKDCKTITCDIYAGDKKLLSKTLPVIRDGSSVGVKAVSYKVINNVAANASLNWDSVTSQTAYPTQKPDKGKYCYVMTIVLYTDGTSTNTVSTSYTPNDGVAGTSVKVTSTKVEYAGGDSGTTAPASGWQGTVPQLSQGKYLWTRTTVAYSDGNSTTSYSVGRIGMDGSKGGTTHILYASSDHPSSADDVRTTIDAGHQYYGTYQDTEVNDDVNKYTEVKSWVLVKGEKGDPGKDGKDGKSARRTAVVNLTSDSGTVFNGSYQTMLRCRVMIDGKSMGGRIPKDNFAWSKDGTEDPNGQEGGGPRHRLVSSSDALDLWKCNVKIPKRLLEPIELTAIGVDGTKLLIRASEDISGMKLYPCWKRYYRIVKLKLNRNAWGFHDMVHDMFSQNPTPLPFTSLGNNNYSVDMSQLLFFVEKNDIILHSTAKVTTAKTALKHGKHTYWLKQGTDGKYHAWGRYGVWLADSNYTPISTVAKCKIYVETDSDTSTTGIASLSV